MFRAIRSKFASKPLMLGRWTPPKTKTIMDRKIELANHDHCGTCPLPKKGKISHDSFDSSMEVSLCALQSFHCTPSKLNTASRRTL